MSKTPSPIHPALKAAILAVLDANRILCVATVRPDGWPQATLVGYVHDDLAIYFVIAADSQKRENIRREPRVSIAIGQDGADHIRGLSMAARAVEVTDVDEVERLNLLIAQRYPQQILFAPREMSAALMRATPTLISLIDHSTGPGTPTLVEIVDEVGGGRIG